ncbi:ABC transporter ATP-binding protein [Vaginisenegalia massiliensis]|uniref:ABC transporter ATP-binding protein n=1 Tax=Vaginisenegalia massiliensis TaxID=2058294 RepID=UPI0019D0A440|nr:ABC transporter ATP-binding protein [Vaginisenegalia massiliensis]
MENKVEVRQLVRDSDNFKLGPLSFTIPKGFVTGFIGRNGAGKTTTIRTILSLLHHQGTILVDNQPITSLDYLQDVGLVMDEPILGKDWNMKLVNQAMKVGYHAWDETCFYQYLRRFGLAEEKKVSQLSRGMKIKLMLAIALSHQAKLLILDEPTSGLDPMMRDEFVSIIQEFMEKEDHTVLFSTHITQDLEAIADYIIYLDQGQVVSATTKEDFVDQFRLLKLDEATLHELQSESILGLKRGQVINEVLVHQHDPLLVLLLPQSEIVSIDKIMSLYGRR